MAVFKNPFTIGMIQDEHLFCNRKKEQEDLIRYARNSQNVVLCSPRRYGKSSLVQIVLKKLKKEGFLTTYADLFPVSSEKDFVARFARSIFKNISNDVDSRTFIEKIKGIFSNFIPTLEVSPEGYSVSAKYDTNAKTEMLLDDLMEGLYRFVKANKSSACVVLDEFQEITELPESKKIEGILRSHIQSHREISYFYVGSRRRILEDMFSSKARPFYKSAFFYQLKEVPEEEFVSYIVRLFDNTGKMCENVFAEKIYRLVRGYPYYVQKLASIVWDNTANKCSDDIVQQSLETLISSEAIDCEGMWSGLTMAQKTVIKQFASEPTSSPFTKVFIEKVQISSSGLQKIIKILSSKDILEKTQEGIYRLTDPVMEMWLVR